MKSFDMRNTRRLHGDAFTQRPLGGDRTMRYARSHIDFAKRW